MLSQPSSSGVAPVTPQMIQQMIIHAFSALGISGKNSSLSSLWYIDSGASNNHMTFPSSNLSNIQTYDNKHQVHTADGEKLSITAIGDASNPLPSKNVLLSPGLSTRFPLDNLLTIIVMYHFLLLVLWCRIPCLLT